MSASKNNENEVGRTPLEVGPPWWRSAWAECVGLVLLVGLPLIFIAAAIVSPAAPDRLACGDDGNIELFTWHALHDAQLSSIRTHGNLAEHLGPMYFYLLAPLYGVFGCKYAGLQLGAIAINLLAIGGVLGVARRCGGWPAMLWAALLLACYMRFVSMPWLASVWLPWVVILPLLATVFLTAGLISGRAYCLPAVAFVASFIVQTQLGYTLVLAVLIFLSLLALVPRVRSWLALDRRLSGSLPRAMWITAVVLAIVWTPPAIKQILGMRGRISETISYFARQGASHSWPEAEKTLGCAIAAFPASLAGVDLKRVRIAESFDGPSGHRALVLLLTVPQVVVLPLVCLLARRRRRDFDLAICLLAAALIPLCLLSIRRLAGGIVFHHVFWMTALGLLNMYVIGGALLAELGPWLTSGRGLRARWAALGAVLAIGLISLGNAAPCRARLALGLRRSLRLVQSRSRRHANRGRRRKRREAFPGTCRAMATRAWHPPLSAADHRTAPLRHRHGDDPGLDQRADAARARSVVCAGLRAASPPAVQGRRRSAPAVQSPLRRAIPDQARRGDRSPNHATPCCSGAMTTPWASSSGQETPDERTFAGRIAGRPAAKDPLRALGGCPEPSVCGRSSAGPLAEPVLRSLAISLVLFILPGLSLTGAMIGCGWLKRWSWMWVVFLSFAIFMGIVMAQGLMGLAVDGRRSWNATWIITNLAAGLSLLLGGEPAWGLRLRQPCVAIGVLVFLAAYGGYFYGACHVVENQEDHDCKIQATAHALLTRLRPESRLAVTGDELFLTSAADSHLRGRLVLVSRPVRASGRLRSGLPRGRATGMRCALRVLPAAPLSPGHAHTQHLPGGADRRPLGLLDRTAHRQPLAGDLDAAGLYGLPGSLRTLVLWRLPGNPPFRRLANVAGGRCVEQAARPRLPEHGLAGGFVCRPGRP